MLLVSSLQVWELSVLSVPAAAVVVVAVAVDAVAAEASVGKHKGPRLTIELYSRGARSASTTIESAGGVPCARRTLDLPLVIQSRASVSPKKKRARSAREVDSESSSINTAARWPWILKSGSDWTKWEDTLDTRATGSCSSRRIGSQQATCKPP